MIIKKDRIIYYFLGCLMIWLLSHIYTEIISVKYQNSSSFGDYANPEGSFSIFRYLISIVSFFPFVFILKARYQSIKSVDIVIYIYTLFAVIPALTMYTVGLNSSFFLLVLQLCMLLLFIYILKYSEQSFSVGAFLPKLRIKEYIYIPVLMALFITLCLYLYLKIGSTSQVSSITNVYLQRAAVAESHGFSIHIITSFLIYGLSNFLVFWSLLNKHKLNLLILLLGVLIVFISTGSKAMLVSPILVIGGYQIYVKKIKIIFIFYFLTASLLIIYFILPDSSPYTSLVARRLLIIHGQLFNLYFEFTVNNGMNLLYKYTNALIANDHNNSISFVIGNIYYGNSTHANSGMVSDAYANFGVFGVVFYAGILGFFLNRVERLNLNGVYPMLFPSSLALTDSSVLAVLVFQLLPLFFILMLWTPKAYDQ